MQDKVSTLQPIELQLPVMSVAEMRKAKGGGDYGPDPGNGCYDFGDDLWDDIKQFFDGIGDGLGDLFGDIGDGLGDIWDAVDDLFDGEGDPDYDWDDFDINDLDREDFIDNLVDEGWLDDFRNIIEQYGQGNKVYPWDPQYDKNGDNTSPWENPAVTSNNGTIADITLYNPDNPMIHIAIFERVTELLDNNSIINSLLSEFDDTSDSYPGQLIFKIGDLSDTTVARFNYPSSMSNYYFDSWFPYGPPSDAPEYTLTINSDFLNPGTTDFIDVQGVDYEGTFFAGTIAHETSHAQITLMFDQVLREGFAAAGPYSAPPYNGTYNFMYRQAVTNQAAAYAESHWTSPAQQALFDAIFDKDPATGDYSMNQLTPAMQHELMANYYRETIIEAMKEYDDSKGVTNSEDWYQAASWIGLQGTDAWDTFSSDPANSGIVALAQEIAQNMQP